MKTVNTIDLVIFTVYPGLMPARPARIQRLGSPARPDNGPGRELVAVARALAGAARWPGSDAVEERSWRQIECDPAFEAWLIAWPPGGGIDLHDHGPSRGAFVVVEGVLTEAAPARDRHGRFELRRRRIGSGHAVSFEPGHVHDVANEGVRSALSLHVYSPRLTSMTFYDLSANGLVERAHDATLSDSAVAV
jgi:predicted metal-dependent enzyme (double-stranded beta helix superfamily)